MNPDNIITTLINKWRRLLIIAVCFATVVASSAVAKQQSASINARVAAGENQITRLRDLPEGAFVSVAVDIDGNATIMLLDEENVQLPAAQRKPLFSGETSDRISLSVTIPESGNYYVLVDNENGSSDREFSLTVTASADLPAASVQPGGNRQKLNRINAELAKFEQNLRVYFVFDELKFQVARCGTANAFSSSDTVIICAEIGPKLRNVMGDDAKALAALHFAMMHEIGHVLLQQWGYPFHDNEEVADEFATALLVLFKHGDRARSQAEYFSKIPAGKEFEVKRSRDDRHPLSVQRARNILRWLDDPDLLGRWQKVFVPHLQTDILRAMTSSTEPWIDHDFVQKELASRSS